MIMGLVIIFTQTHTATSGGLLRNLFSLRAIYSTPIDRDLLYIHRMCVFCFAYSRLFSGRSAQERTVGLSLQESLRLSPEQREISH